MNLNDISAYKNVEVSTGVELANGHKLIDMLYEGILQRLSEAKNFISNNNISQKGVVIGKAITIIDGLRSGLDQAAGGEIAQNLDDLYDYMQRRLLHANLENDVRIVDEVIALIVEVKQAWVSIPEESRNVAPNQLGQNPA